MIAAARTLPHSLDAEQSLLGSLLLDSSAMDTLADELTEDVFFREAHRRIYRALSGLYSRGIGIDIVTAKDALLRAGDLEFIGGPAYLSSLIDGGMRGANLEYYARIVRRTAAKRAVIFAANKVLAEAYEDGTETPELLDSAERALLAISDVVSPGDLVSSGQIAQNIFPVLEALVATGHAVTGIPTGLTALDRYTRGLQEGNLVIIGGRPGSGKSTLGLQFALEVSQTRPVAFFSVEMSQQEQAFRVLATLAMVDGHHLQCGQLSMADQQQVGYALTAFEARQFWLDDSSSLSALQIRARARRLQAQHGLGLIVVDYIQLLSHPRADSREERVAQTCRLLKQIARELHVPILALCQLSRKSEDRPSQRPQLSDLRESGAIEQDADVVLLIHRPAEKTNGVVTEVPPVELIIAKQRNGPTTSLDLAWRREQYRFAEVESR